MENRRVSLGDLLNAFPANEIAAALVRAGLPGGGKKIERLERLRSAGRRSGVKNSDVLNLFSESAIRRVATRMGIREPGKAAMIAGLAAMLSDSDSGSPETLPATMHALRQIIRGLNRSFRSIRDEADAEIFVASALADHFNGVSKQALVPGHLGHRIDIDIGQGQLGIEIKLATSIVDSSSEAYRLLGQAFYYDRRRYAGRLLVVIVGPRELANHPIIGELVALLGALGVSSEYLQIG